VSTAVNLTLSPVTRKYFQALVLPRALPGINPSLLSLRRVPHEDNNEERHFPISLQDAGLFRCHSTVSGSRFIITRTTLCHFVV
jgi:hypothetical protein